MTSKSFQTWTYSHKSEIFTKPSWDLLKGWGHQVIISQKTKVRTGVYGARSLRCCLHGDVSPEKHKKRCGQEFAFTWKRRQCKCCVIVVQSMRGRLSCHNESVVCRVERDDNEKVHFIGRFQKFKSETLILCQNTTIPLGFILKQPSCRHVSDRS